MTIASSRLSASRGLLQRHNLYGSPPRPYFSMKKSRQKSLGEDPETPNASVHPARKAKERLPGAGLDDAYKVNF